MVEETQITANDCEEICDRLLGDFSPNIDKVYLWAEVWRRLVSNLGHGDDPNYDLILPPPNLNEPDTEDNRISAIRGELYKLLDNHSKDARECMKVFDRINVKRG